MNNHGTIRALLIGVLASGLMACAAGQEPAQSSLTQGARCLTLTCGGDGDGVGAADVQSFVQSTYPGASYLYIDIICDPGRCGVFIEWNGHWLRVECWVADDGSLVCAIV